MKAQIIIEEDSGQMTATFFGKGRTHDYKLFQKSGVRVGKHLKLRADLGYWGLQSETAKAIVPLKNSKLHQLTRSEKKFNRELAKGASKSKTSFVD